MIRVLIVDDHELLRASCAAGSSASPESPSSGKLTRLSGRSCWQGGSSRTWSCWISSSHGRAVTR